MTRDVSMLRVLAEGLVKFDKRWPVCWFHGPTVCHELVDAVRTTSRLTQTIVHILNQIQYLPCTRDVGR